MLLVELYRNVFLDRNWTFNTVCAVRDKMVSHANWRLLKGISHHACQAFFEGFFVGGFDLVGNFVNAMG